MMLPVRPRREAGATTSFYLLSAVAAFSYALCFTLNLVFQFRVIGLDPFQMVMVGTVLELTCFLFEVPTGLVADLYSRRASVIVGFFLVGAGFVCEGAVTTFAAAIIGNVIWGIGSTFTSGALQAWITDEVGQEHVAPVFARQTQLGLTFGLAGTLTAGLLGVISLRLPVIVAGVMFMGLAVLLLAIMPERHFEPTPRGDRESFDHLRHQFMEGLAVARNGRVVKAFLLVSLLVGLASEVVDRLWQVHILNDFVMPSVFGHDEAIAFTVFAVIGTAISLGASLASGRWLPKRVVDEQPGLPVAIAAFVQVAGVLGVALFANLWLVLAALWVRGACAAFSAPIESTWINRNLDSSTRATVLSMNEQANAIGQVGGGPPLGALATRTSIPIALVAASAIQLPSVVAFLRVRRLAGTPTRNTGGLDLQ